MTNNEKIITTLFNALKGYNPKLALLLDEDEDEVDTRELGAKIISSFPWPIGVELRRLFSAGMERSTRGRLDQIFKTIERTMQFTSFVLLSQLLEEYQAGKCELSSDFATQFPNRISGLTMGDYAWMIRSIGNIFEGNDINPFVAEMASLFDKKFYAKLDFWVPERNDIGHYLINLTDEKVEIRCFEYQEKLTVLLSDLAFLLKYPLVTITEIRVLKRKRSDAQFSHEMKILNSASSDFFGKEKCFDKFSDNHSVLLLKSLNKTPYEYLNLSPLIIDTTTDILNTPDKIKKIKKDIFLFTKWQKERLFYLGTEVTEKCDLRLLSFYDELVIEFKEYLTAFKSGKTKSE